MFVRYCYCSVFFKAAGATPPRNFGEPMCERFNHPRPRPRVTDWCTSRYKPYLHYSNSCGPSTARACATRKYRHSSANRHYVSCDISYACTTQVCVFSLGYSPAPEWLEPVLWPRTWLCELMWEQRQQQLLNPILLLFSEMCQANSHVLACWLAFFFALVFIAVGIAWPSHLAVLATCISVS